MYFGYIVTVYVRIRKPCSYEKFETMLMGTNKICSRVTMLHVAMASIERYVAIYLFVYEEKMTDRVVHVMIRVAWVTGTE